MYRHQNAERLATICEQCGGADQIHLWALDRRHPTLDTWTAGEGPGLRSDLLNALYSRVPEEFPGLVLLSDDDYEFTNGGLSTFIATAVAASLDIAQPGHDRLSRWSHWLTVARRLSIVRLTTFVEIGPLVAISPRWRSRVLPFPEDSGMGWGTDLAWSDLRAEGCRLGVVDSTLLRHVNPVVGADAYDVQAGIQDMEPLYAARGGYHAALRTLGTWWPWQRRPTWAR